MGKPGAKKMDQIVSVTPGDVHIIMIPSPGGPVPTPIPHPCASMIKDNVATKVKVMGQPGAVKGSKSKHTPPHIPMGPGPFQKPPKNEGEIITGSANVFYEGKEAAMLGDTGKMCSDPSDTPVGKVIGTAATVLVGGGGSDGGGDGSGDGSGKKAGGAGSASLGDTTGTGHPVDVATGNLIVSGDDFGLDGPLPIQFVRTYVSAGASTKGPLGYGWVHNFQESMQLVLEGDDDWKQIHEELSDAGNPAPDRNYVIYRDPNGLATRYRLPREGEELVDEFHRRKLKREGSVFSVTNRHGIVNRFGRLPGGDTLLRLIEVVDRNGNKNLFRYAPEGLLNEVEDCYGRTLIIAYEGHRVSELRLRIPGRETAQRWCAYKYDPNGDLVEVIDRAGFSNKFAYADHLIIQDQNRDGYSFFFAYDRSRRCVRTWGQDGYLTRYLKYDAEKRRTLETNGEGEHTLYHSTPSGVVRRVDKGDDCFVELTFDDVGRVIHRANAQGTIVAIEYDGEGNVVSLTDAEGNSKTMAYNPFGQVIKVTDALGQESTYEYDGRGNMVLRRESPDQVTHYEHDSRGRVIREIGPEKVPIEFSYDQFGHICQAVQDGKVSHKQWDPLGNPLTEKHPDGPPIAIEWNESGFPSRITSGQQTVASYAYTPEGHVLMESDARGILQETKYGPPGVPIQIRYYRLTSTGERVFRTGLALRTDTEGRPVEAVDQDGRKRMFEYDSAGRLARETSTDGEALQFSYDGAQRIAGIQTRAGKRTRIERDNRGLPLRITYPDDAHDTFEYDELARPVFAANESEEVSFEFDLEGRQVLRRQGAFEIKAEFNGEASAAWRLSGGPATEFSDDPDSNASIINFGGRKILLHFDEIGRVRRKQFANGVVEAFDYHSRFEIGKIEVTGKEGALNQTKLEYGENGQVISVSDTTRGTRRYSYDKVGRLERVTGDSEEHYKYDERDNVLGSQWFSDAGVEAHDRLVRAGGRFYSYDERSYVESITDPAHGRLKFYYSGKGETIRIALPDGGKVHYKYDAFGRRIEKRFEGGARDGQVVRFFWNGDLVVHEETWIGEEKRSERNYLFQGHQPLARIDTVDGVESAIFYHNDAVGTPQYCTDEEGKIVWRFRGDAFGYEADREDGFQNIRLPGQYYDEETRLCYNRYRYYDPLIGRYLQPDPIVDPAEPNRFNYPRNPLSFGDPLGLSTLILVGDPGDKTISDNTTKLKNNYGPKAKNLFSFFGPNLKGVDHIVINAHGNDQIIAATSWWDRLLGRKRYLTGAQMAEYLKKKGFKGTMVTVVSCRAGSPGATVAPDLAKGLGQANPDVEVIAWAGKVGVRQDGVPRMGKALDPSGSGKIATHDDSSIGRGTFYASGNRIGSGTVFLD